MFKPFKPPSLVKRPEATESQKSDTTSQPPNKRRKVIGDEENTRKGLVRGPQPVYVSTTRPSAPLVAKPALLSTKSPLPNPTAVASQTANATETLDGQYAVLWRVPTNKKNKTWDGDGVVTVSKGYAILRNDDGKEMGRTALKTALSLGAIAKIGGKEIEVESIISGAGAQLAAPRMPTTAFLPPRASQPSLLPQAKVGSSQGSGAKPLAQKVPSKKPNASFKNPLLEKSVVRAASDGKARLPRHDPHAKGALVMKRPKCAPSGKHIVDVVVDPMLSKHLREHQRAGVAFLYECVMGMRQFEGEGAILADEMGLGKTLQTIALIWTLLKQNPIYEDGAVLKKVLIVTPVTLINNWKKEFRKWLGNERIGVMVAENNKTRIKDFTKGKSYNVLIIGYEKLRNVQEELQKCDIDIVIADEGHRIKTKENKAAAAIRTLNTERRVILSGTPIQNDLSEFYTMVDFVNPGLLGKYAAFKRDFETPILRSRQPEASDKDMQRGQERSEELGSITSQFILRRTSEILSEYLPPKTEYILYCRPTAVQVAIYEAVVSTGVFSTALRSADAGFALINILKKLCNSPSLLSKKAANEEGEITTMTALLADIPPSQLRSPSGSSKLHVLDSLLHAINTTTDDKIVIVSNYTSTLDMIAKLLTALSYPFSRLDGSTPPAHRQDIVDKFNRAPASSLFIFLLSAKAGGTGLNLIGANRLVLYDIDWNPATDLQAMARIHRDGQTRPCYIYRLLTKGALEEKIFQRQVTKQGLSESIVDSKTSVNSFSKDDLADLFTLDRSEACQTHDAIGCACGGYRVSPASTSAPTPEAATPTGTVDANAVADDEDEDADADLPSLSDLHRTSFVPSSQVDVAAQERELVERRTAGREKLQRRKGQGKGKGEAKMLSLMSYAHVDPRVFRRRALELQGESVGGAVVDTGAEAKKEDEDADTGADEDETTTASGPESERDLPPLALETVIKDDALRAVIEEAESRVDFVFAKTNA